MDDLDRSQPWQTQYAERFSRSINQGSPYAKRQLRLFGLSMALLAVGIVVLFVVLLVWHAAFG